MAFYPALEEGICPLYRDQDAYAIDITLGYDTTDGVVVVMSVILFEDPEASEICFGIRKRQMFPPYKMTGLEETDYDSKEAKKYVAASARSFVTTTILACIRLLILRAKPTALIMETFHPHLPAKAMRKYRQIINELKEMGFKLFLHERAADGKDHWFLNK